MLSLLRYALERPAYVEAPWWRFDDEGSFLRAWARAAVCRLRGHPRGPEWVNPGGLEPDMHCKTCGDDLG